MWQLRLAIIKASEEQKSLVQLRKSIRLLNWSFWLCVWGANCFASNVSQSCAETSPWPLCAQAVKQELDQHPYDPQQVIALALAWQARVNQFSNSDESTSDINKVVEKFNPYEFLSDKTEEVAKAKAKEAGVRLARTTALGRFLWKSEPPESLTSILFPPLDPISIAFNIVKDPSEIATEYDELRMADNDITETVAVLMSPYVEPWQSTGNISSYLATKAREEEFRRRTAILYGELVDAKAANAAASALARQRAEDARRKKEQQDQDWAKYQQQQEQNQQNLQNQGAPLIKLPSSPTVTVPWPSPPPTYTIPTWRVTGGGSSCDDPCGDQPQQPIQITPPGI